MATSSRTTCLSRSQHLEPQRRPRYRQQQQQRQQEGQQVAMPAGAARPPPRPPSPERRAEAAAAHPAASGGYPCIADAKGAVALPLLLWHLVLPAAVMLLGVASSVSALLLAVAALLA